MSSPFSGITPTSFLQTFVLELMNAREQSGPAEEQLSERIGCAAGKFFEDSFREEYGKQGPLTREESADAAPPADAGKSARRQAMAKADRERLEQALQRFQGNVAQAARWLELTPRAV